MSVYGKMNGLVWQSERVFSSIVKLKHWLCVAVLAPQDLYIMCYRIFKNQVLKSVDVRTTDTSM